MTEGHPAPPPRKTPRNAALMLQRWGWAILATGLVAAVLIYLFSPDTTDAEFADRIARGRMYRHNVELMGGTAGLLIDDFDRWFSSLWQGKALAATIAVITLVAGFGCLAIAHFAANPGRNQR